MKKILITGIDSYIGNQLALWLSQEADKYEVTKVSVRAEKWKKYDFSIYDVVVHVAGIAHQDTKKNLKNSYYKTNTELTINLAEKAKIEGVTHFIFLSSMIVYGMSGKIDELKVITEDTIPKPMNFYGNSKLMAEKGIVPLENSNFKIAILRPPMIYGKGSKGNYPLIAKFAKVSPFFPNYANKRSMLHIDNLTEFIRLIIDNEDSGVFFPQNKDYVNTSHMVKIISEVNNHNLKLIKIFNFFIRVFGRKFNITNKIFGNFVYDQKMSEYKSNYRIRSFLESIQVTEK